jgi:hypothetical protein
VNRLFIWDEHKEERIELPYDAKEPVLLEVFTEGKNKIDSVSEYAHGFWCRYLTAIPKRLVSQPSILQISRFTDKKAHRNNK